MPFCRPHGVVCIYGPFRYAGRYTSDSNRDFDRMLKERDPLSGLRDLKSSALLPSATRCGFESITICRPTIACWSLSGFSE